MGPIVLIVDAGPLYALIDKDDRNHEVCRMLFESHEGSFVVPQLVIAEVAYLIGTRLDVRAEVRFLADLAAGNFRTEPVLAEDWPRIAELVGKYRDLPLGTVDASVIATAERYWATTIATTDRRHFSVVRPKHVRAFEIVP